MADRVYFGTRNDTVTPANSSAFNGFPWPYSTGSTTGRISVAFKKNIKWWWRVKNWKITTDAAIVDNNGDPFSFVSGDFTPNSGITRELQLIGGTRHFIRGDGTTYGATFNVMESPQIIKSGASLYPGLDLEAFVASTDPAGGSMVFRFSSGASTMSGSVDGETITVHYEAGVVAPGSFSITTMAIEPVEYWPYANSQGQPIYDTVTGAIINSPTG